MNQSQIDRNHWENELTDDDNFLIKYYGWPALTEQQQHFFNRLESWHQAFFLSLARHPRLKLSLEQALVRDSKAERLYWRYAEIREHQLHSIMTIANISVLVFPLVEYDIERQILEDNIVSAIEHEGLTADGLKWNDMRGNLALSEDEQWKEFFKNYSKEGQKKRRENFLYARVNINDLDALAATGALHWRIIKYLRVWRYFLQDRNKVSNVPKRSLTPVFDKNDKPRLLYNANLQKEYMYRELQKLASEQQINLLDFPRGFKSIFRKQFLLKYPEIKTVFEDRWKELVHNGLVHSAFAPNRKKT